METVLVGLKNEKAKKLLDSLAELDLIELKKISGNTKENSKTRLSDLKNLISHKMTEKAINQQIKALRKEWQRDI